MGRLFEEEDLLGRAKNRSRINLSNQGNIPARFSDKDMSQKRTRKKDSQEKYLRESYYHRIKCITATFLVAFVWIRPLSSAALATTTHRRSEGVSNGTSTQITTQMINKCRIKRVQEGLYKGKDPP